MLSRHKRTPNWEYKQEGGLELKRFKIPKGLFNFIISNGFIEKRAVPGPNAYFKHKDLGINRMGKYFVSKFHNSMSRSFTKEAT